MQNCRFPKGKAEVWTSWSLLKVCPHTCTVCLAGHWKAFSSCRELDGFSMNTPCCPAQHGFGALWQFQQHIPAHLPALPLPSSLWGSHTELIVNEAEESLGFPGHCSPELLLLSWHTQSQHCGEALSPPPTAPFSPKLRAGVNCNPLLKKSSLRVCAGRKEKAPRGAGAQLQRLPSLQHSLSPSRVTLSSLCPFSHTFCSFSF